MSELSPVQAFYKGRTIFVTGASGFMGKVLIEKLLYQCYDLKEIIILMRPKKGLTPEARLENMFKLPMFKRIRDERPEVLKKLTLIQGDVTAEKFGLTDEIIDRICKESSIVFHLAATLRLEGNLTDAITMNLTGTKRALDIAKKMKNLVAFVHVSTAFCNCDHEIMYEKVYDFPHRPEDLMRMVEWLDVKTIDKITKDLLGEHPNTYTYSKRLSEILVRDQYPEMPVIITRPSIVSPAAFEPVEGWVDNLNGPTGILVGGAKGVIRSMLVDGKQKSEVIPVDYAINGLITIVYEFGSLKERPKEIPVFNITCNEERKVPWETVMEMGKELAYKYPLEPGLWYPDGCITMNKFYHQINVILFHWLPAYLVDFLLLCFGQKRFMIRVQKRISTGLEVLQFFTTRAWDFRSANFERVFENLSKTDKILFNMDNSKIDDREYMKAGILGGRLFILKEPLSTIPRARKQLWAMYILDRACKLIILALLLNWFLSKIGLI